MSSPSALLSTKPWYSRPRPVSPPAKFEQLLAEAIDTLNEAATFTPCVLASSLSVEDMVLFHLIQQHHLPISTFALDTGRLPQATIDLWAQAEAHYGVAILRVTPAADRLAALGQAQSESAIYETKAARELCCTVRKTEPLRGALSGQRAWVTGLRRAQSAGRADVPLRAYDPGFNLEKFNPLASWTDEALWFLVDQASIPVSRLYDQGYASIGCDPCTRPIRFDEHPRAGRWWWEAATTGTATECGIHVVQPPAVGALTSSADTAANQTWPGANA